MEQSRCDAKKMAVDEACALTKGQARVTRSLTVLPPDSDGPISDTVSDSYNPGDDLGDDPYVIFECYYRG